MMRPLLQVCVKMILSAVLATSWQVSVEVRNPSMSFNCGPPTTVAVIFQAVTGRSSDGTPIVFERYWVSQITALLALEPLPNPLMNSNIRECANTIASAGHDGFEFSAGTCTAIKLSHTLCCEEVSGSHVYVSELFDGGSGELKNFTEQRPGVTVQSFSPIVDISKMLDSSSSDDENGDLTPALGKATIKLADGKIYTFSVDYIDVANCRGSSACGPFLFFTRDSSSSSPTSPLYFTDYCGSAIPEPIVSGQAILSHRGFGCEYMPEDLLNNVCEVEIRFDDSDWFRNNMYFYDYIDGDSCDGLSLFLNQTDGRGNQELMELCNPKNYDFLAGSGGVGIFRLSVTKVERLGFIFGHIRVDGP